MRAKTGMHPRSATRRGTTAVEFAAVAPVTFLMLLGLLVGGLGTFQYQELSYLASESARWASVHGTQYAAQTGQPAATATTVYQQVIEPKAVMLNLADLTYSVTWNTSNSPTTTTIVGGNPVTTANTVTVTLTYQWIPQAYLGGVTMTSTSVCTMSF
jgi:Flp pilus assembly protein TadG